MCLISLLVLCGFAPIFLVLCFLCLGRNDSLLLFLFWGYKEQAQTINLKDSVGTCCTQILVLGSEGL